MLVGPAVAGIVLAQWRYPAAYAIQALTTAASLTAVARLPAMPASRAGDERHHHRPVLRGIDRHGHIPGQPGWAAGNASADGRMSGDGVARAIKDTAARAGLGLTVIRGHSRWRRRRHRRLPRRRRPGLVAGRGASTAALRLDCGGVHLRPRRWITANRSLKTR
jgi:hypothetical protein